MMFWGGPQPQIRPRYEYLQHIHTLNNKQHCNMDSGQVDKDSR
jgi:hypothetical protein